MTTTMAWKKPLSLLLLLLSLFLPCPIAMAFSIIRRTTTIGSFRRQQGQRRRGPIIVSTYNQNHHLRQHGRRMLDGIPSFFPPRLSLHDVPLLILANSNNIASEFEREFQQKQRNLSDQVTGDDDTSRSKSPEEHSKHQAKVFNELASFFDSEEAIPPEVVPTLQDMVETMIAQMIHQRSRGEETNQNSRPARVNVTTTAYETSVFHVLDVGCGTGALFDFYIKAAEAKKITLHIHGLDLASNMVQRAKSHAKEILAKLPDSSKEHSITVELGDICHADDDDDDADYDDDTNKEQPQQHQYYDLAVANACFGNFWDQKQALKRMVKSLRLDGVLCITHPLGSDFVRQLHDDDPKSVPHLLPNFSGFQQLARHLPLHVLDVVDRDKGNDDESTYYKATAVKVVHQGLSKTMRFRGEVDSGYGRGGKKLGFPTANLPCGVFQGALQDVQCGVYFGWAVLEGTTQGRNTPHKAVVNVGYSPTFEGQENAEKIIEAHLIFPPTKQQQQQQQQQGGDASPPTVLDPPDFYGEVMRLQLVGFIRPEMKFPSFPALIAQITTDVEDARDALDLKDYRDRQKEPFVAEVHDEWIGSGGGDGDASWEFE